MPSSNPTSVPFLDRCLERAQDRRATKAIDNLRVPPGNRSEMLRNVQKVSQNTTPGEVRYEEFLTPHNLSARALTASIVVPQNRLSDIIRGRRSLTADTALRSSRYFGTTPEFWHNLQMTYNLEEARAKLAA